LLEVAGMTHGSLYSQFGSKERLIEEAVGHAITTKQQETPEAFSLRDCVSAYLSAAHRQPAPSSRISRLSFDVGFARDPYARRKPIFTSQHSCRDRTRMPPADRPNPTGEPAMTALPAAI